VTFRWKDYRAKGRDQAKVMALATGEFIRRFLIYVLPDGFHRIRHYGLFANGGRAGTSPEPGTCSTCRRHRARRLRRTAAATAGRRRSRTLVPCCGGRIIIIETFERGSTPRYRPTVPIRIDTS
jgi:Putative transposase